jgi:hypothetical protein
VINLHAFHKNGESKQETGQRRWKLSKEIKNDSTGSEIQLNIRGGAEETDDDRNAHSSTF